MSATQKILYLTSFVLLAMSSCKKNGNSDPSPDTPGANEACVLTGETFGGILTNLGKIVYLYNDEKKLKAVSKINNLNQTLRWITVDRAPLIQDYNEVRSVEHLFTGTNLLVWMPTGQKTYILSNDGTRGEQEYFFNYNQNKQLHNIISDGPDIYFEYDDKGNMNEMTQYMGTGPLVEVAYRARVTYDNKPSPYTALQPMYKFLQHTFRWYSNSNPWLLIAAMSKNNPTRIDIFLRGNDSDEAQRWSLTFNYTYNEKGYPIETKVTSILASGETNPNYAWNRYTYECP